MEQLLSEEALRRTGYFDAEAVRTWRQRYKTLRSGSLQRVSIEMGLVGVVATQLWHQTFIDGSLADVPAARLSRPAGGRSAPAWPTRSASRVQFRLAERSATLPNKEGICPTH